MNVLFVILLLLLVSLSAFFSGSETGVMSLNRYRLRHAAKQGNLRAKILVKLLKRTDRLLGVILLGNTFANVMASALATLIAVHYLGDVGVIVSAVVLTIVILIFAETLPKTWAAHHPQKFAYFASPILKGLLMLVYPLVWLVNTIANSILKACHISLHKQQVEPLSAEELQSVVAEAKGKISMDDQQMLQGILSLQNMDVADIMIPRGEMCGIDITQPFASIIKELQACKHRYMPLYNKNIEHIVGTVKVNRVLKALAQAPLDLNKLKQLAAKPYYVPEGTLVSQQLIHFRKQRQYLSYVVDEYGALQGLLSIKDILEEIVGYFDYETSNAADMIILKKDGSFVVAGSMPLRDLNRINDWMLPLDGPNTLSGLIIERLEFIPVKPLCLLIGNYGLEIIHIDKNTIAQVRVVVLK